MYLNIEFPRRIALGAVRSPWWATSIAQTQAGFEQRNGDWTNARHEYDVSLAVRDASDYTEVLAHFHQARGQLHSFGFKDFLDYRVEQSNGVLLPLGGGIWQLAKQYGAGDAAYVRPITRPAGVVVYVSGVPESFPIDLTTGRVDLGGESPQPAPDALAWSGQFLVPVRYGIERMPAQAINRRAGTGGPLLVQVDGIQLVEVREA